MFTHNKEKHTFMFIFPSYLQLPSLTARIPVQFYFTDLLVGLAFVFVTMWDTLCPDPNVYP